MKNCPKCKRNEGVTLSGWVAYKGIKTQKYICKKCIYSFSTDQVKNKLEVIRQDIIHLLFKGLSFSEIAREVDTHRSTITNWIKKNKSNDGRLVCAEVLTIQLYMEGIDVKEISYLTDIHYRIIRYWVLKNENTPIVHLPVLSNRKAKYSVEPKRKTYHLGYQYHIHYIFNNRKISVGTYPDDMKAQLYNMRTRVSKIERYPLTFKRLRLCQLYLAGASKKDLRIALKYPKMIDVKRALNFAPEFIRNFIDEPPSTQVIILSENVSPEVVVELASGMISVNCG